MKRLSIVFALLLLVPCMAFAGPVPDTGQTKCYDDVGAEIPCPAPGQPFYGQDAQYIVNPPSYTKLDGNGVPLPDDAPLWVTVRDNMTGLIWEVKTNDGSIHDRDNRYNWQEAQDVFITTLNSQQFAGYDDWRLPTIKELSFIKDMDTFNPAINTDYFPGTKIVDYWSSTTRASDAAYAFHVTFDFGSTSSHAKTYDYYARAVRGGQSGSFSDYRDNGDGTVTDMATGLMWEVKTDDGSIRDKDDTYNWQDALAHCEDLILNNDGEWTSGTPNLSGVKYDDWRLPTVNELQSLVNYSTYNPSIDTDYFSHTQPDYYLTSTTRPSNYYLTWSIAFSGGNAVGRNKVQNLGYIRAVRGGTSLQFDVDQDGKPDGPVELLLCEEQTVALDIWLSNWDSTNNSNVTEANYYLTWDDTWLDVLGVSCYDDVHGGPWESGSCVVSPNDPGPNSYRLSVSESGSGIPGHRMKLHTVTLKAIDAPKSASWMKASLVSDGPNGSVTRVSGAPFDEDDIHESENEVSIVCGSDPLEGPYDELQFDYQCPTTATPKPGENDYYELLNEELQPDDTFCKGEMAIISHTYLGSYPATLDNTPPICDSVCFEYKVKNCKYVSGQGCYIKCIHGCRNGFCVDSASKCDEYRERIQCNIISYFQCLNSPYVDLDCGFEINETIAILDDGDENCVTGSPLYEYPLSDYGTAAREIPMPLGVGTYDICAGSTFIDTVTVEDCGSACIVRITENKFEVDQGLTSHLAVNLESDEVGEYSLSLDRFLDDAHTESMYVPSSLQVISPVTITGASVPFEVDAIDPGVENGEIHWANILVMAQGPSVSCEAAFTLDIRNISVNSDCEWDDTFAEGSSVYGRAVLGLSPDTTYDRLYVLDHRTDWTDGMDLTTITLVPGAATSFTTDGYGNMGCSANDKVILWEEAQADPLPAYFDIVIDVNGNGTFDEGTDVLDAKQSPGFGIYTDTDGDLVPDIEDNCREVINPDQLDSNGNCPNPPYSSDPACGDCCEGVDSDSDGVSDACDNCLSASNPGQENSDTDTLGNACDNCPDYDNPNQEDNYPPDGNGCGDVCDCEGDVQSASQGVGYPDGDVDGSDAFVFKQQFGRSDCATSPPCLRDHECDGDVDGSDAFKFKTDFGRSDCPLCTFICPYE